MGHYVAEMGYGVPDPIVSISLGDLAVIVALSKYGLIGGDPGVCLEHVHRIAKRAYESARNDRGES